MLIVRHCGPKRFWGPSATIWSQSTADHCVRLLAGADGDEGCVAAWCGLVGWDRVSTLLPPALPSEPVGLALVWELGRDP
jgi:hypothetical protein